MQLHSEITEDCLWRRWQTNDRQAFFSWWSCWCCSASYGWLQRWSDLFVAHDGVPHFSLSLSIQKGCLWFQAAQYFSLLSLAVEAITAAQWPTLLIPLFARLFDFKSACKIDGTARDISSFSSRVYTNLEVGWYVGRSVRTCRQHCTLFQQRFQRGRLSVP